MSTFTQILYQIVFGSKNITSFLTTDNKQPLFNYIAGISRNKKCVPYQIGGYGNHLHLILALHPSQSLAGLVQEIKKSSHEWMFENRNNYLKFPGWQVGYGAFTYKLSAKNNLVRYVKNQEPHHRKVTFLEEYEELLKEHGIVYERKYLFV